MNSMQDSFKKYTVLYQTLGLVFAADQVTKFFVTQYSEELGITISYNYGISFSFLSGLRTTVLTLLLVLLVAFLYRVYESVWKEHQYAAGLFFGGAATNIFDRIIFGAVRDWIYIPFTDIQNNLADIAIFLGLILLVLHSYDLRPHDYK